MKNEIKLAVQRCSWKLRALSEVTPYLLYWKFRLWVIMVTVTEVVVFVTLARSPMHWLPIGAK